MMKLSTLWNVHRLDGPEGRNPLADQIVERWQHDPGTARLFRSSANFVFRFQHEGERCFLRIADGVERARKTIEAEVDLVRWLAGHGVHVALPIRSRYGHDLESLTTDWGTFHVVAFEGLAGSQRDIETLDAAGFRAWGAALGRLHRAMRAYTGPARTGRSTWQDQLTLAARHTGDDPLIQIEIDRVAAALGALPTGDDRVGLIHGDFELDNLCWREDGVGILDFDDCARSWLVADIAFALRDLFGDVGDGIDLRHASFRAFLDGYAGHHPLDQELVAYLPTFRRFGNLVRYARIVRSVDLADEPTYPTWLRTLRGKLVSVAEAYRASFTSPA
jgi:Ser/Thr protein kinase RdoA (MazF antagonist)